MIRKQDLGAMDFIAAGAIGNVYRLPDFALPGFRGVAYKEVKAAELSTTVCQEAIDAMTRSVAFRAALGPADRADLDEYTTWPIDMVQENGKPCGIVMPLISDAFFIRTNPPGGTSKKRVYELSWLCAKETQAKSQGVDRSGTRDILPRIALLAQLVYAVGRLHRHGAVYGDLSLKNAAMAIDPPRIKLLDCDAAAALSDPTRRQMHSPFFMPPEIASGAQKLQDDRTDIYKLGVCVIRGLQQGPGVSQTVDPAGLRDKLDATAVDVIARAVGPDRAARPTARELFDCLERNLQAKVSPPQLLLVGLNRTALPRGQDVEIVWHATGGTKVRIIGANGLDVEFDDLGGAPTCRMVTPLASGAIAVEVSNRHGSAHAVAGDVTLYDLPAFRVDLTGLPRPLVPRVPAVPVPPVAEFLPRVSVEAPTEPARMKLPPLSPVSDVLAAMRTVPNPIYGLAAIASAAEAWRPRRGAPTPPPHPDPGAAATRAVAGIHDVFDDAGRRLRDQMAAGVDSAVRRGTRRT